MPENSENPISDIDGEEQGLSRRELLKRAGLIVGAAAVAPAVALVPGETAATATTVSIAAPAEPQTDPNALRSLTRLEYDTLDAICSRIIPTDENGPGAKEARTVRYIDWGLAGYLNNGGGGRGGASPREQYAKCLAAVEAYALSTKGVSFSRLSPADQDTIVNSLAQNQVPAAPMNFFNTIRTHTIEGTFSDPFYGGNYNATGWELIGYPGVRISVPAEYQQWGNKLEQGRQSAYDHAMFRKGVI
jgi:gluconate 2-dehydrogenase gamma chain